MTEPSKTSMMAMLKIFKIVLILSVVGIQCQREHSVINKAEVKSYGKEGPVELLECFTSITLYPQMQCDDCLDRDGKDMSISEQRQCYVYGQCQVMNVSSWLSVACNIILHALI